MTDARTWFFWRRPRIISTWLSSARSTNWFRPIAGRFLKSAHSAAAAAILIWLITFAGVALVGVPLLIHEGMSLGELKRLAEGEKQREEQQLESGNA